LHYADTWQSGIYTVQFGSPVGSEERFAVNVDTTESDLNQIGDEELQNEVWPGVPFSRQTSWQDLDTAVAVTTGRGGLRLHIVLLYAVLFLLLAELLVAGRWKKGNVRTENARFSLPPSEKSHEKRTDSGQEPLA
jgi:hypothetical protein